MSSTDREIPERVVSFWEGFGRDKPDLRRALSTQERGLLERRAAELSAAFEPYPDSSRASLGAAVAGMLGGFFNTQRSGDNAAAITMGYLMVLRERPHWAIVKACQQVREGKVNINDRAFAPSEAQFNHLVGEVIVPYRARFIEIDALLRARAPSE